MWFKDRIAQYPVIVAKDNPMFRQTTSPAAVMTLALATFGCGCSRGPIDVEKVIKDTPLYVPQAAEASEHATAAKSQHQEILNQVIRAEKLLEAYRALCFSPDGLSSLTIGKDQIAPELASIYAKMDLALMREDSDFTTRQSVSIEQSSKSLRIVTRLLETEELREGWYVDGGWATNLDHLYETQGDLAFTRLHLSGAIR
jgi:hypothetical protein